jgi:hypothetical protein
MTPSVLPSNPIFRSSGERAVFEALLPQLSDEDVVFANLEIADSIGGDIEIDFAILLKQHGLIVVEVKGGHISHDGRDWIQTDPSGSRPMDLVWQTKRNMYAVRDFLHSKWSLGFLRSGWVVAFPFSNVSDPQDPALPVEKIIQKSELPFALAKMKSVLNLDRSTPLPSFDDWVGVASKNLLPVVVQKTNPEAVLGDNYEYISSLTHERDIVLDQLADNIRYYVKGPAGSGKTWLAFEQARRWTSDGKRVAILAFNHGLVSYMNRKNSELPEGAKVSYVGTFHEYAQSIGSTAGDPAHYRDQTDRYQADLILKASDLSAQERFDAFVIDDAQDFLPAWWEVINLSLTDPELGRIALFGDDQQQVFGDRPEPTGNFAILRLTENLRNSQQIAQAISSLIARPSIARGPRSFEIEYVIVESGQKIHHAADDVIERLVDVERWVPSTVALLTTKHRHAEQAMRDDKDREDNWRSLWEDDEVFYCTVGGFKGLERPAVVLAIDGFHPDIDPDDVLYVGMSRARDRLVIVGHQEDITRIQTRVTREETRNV